ncbi:phosphatidylinositol kinase [Rhodovibrio sodomensis]|uniref:Phosphatidylinositol kinase n=1 Tax=Rhodovibrio sodomensis TaxID=1088 RepID=A0ABS1DHI6_9PROT|nr:type II toxin-antitoxin system HipA family toxin [Rhodovibrio sodomensis]MBK1669940.1 phosphatidylinositol kinase [Rhodovibrio sodomensis]
MTSECYVYIVPPGQTEFVTAARFRRETTDRGPIGRFIYGRKYLAREDATELDPVELTLRSGVFETARLNGFFGAIRDAMPDFWGRRVIEKRAGLTQLDDFDYLLNGPDDRAGALAFGRNQQPPPPQRNFNETRHLDRLQDAADAIVADEPVSNGQLEDLLLLGTSMGGGRPKAVVQADDDLWIAKFSRPDDRFNNPRVEKGLLDLAAAAGIDVPSRRIETIGGRDILLVRRFDRDPTVGGYRRHRMVSGLTLLRTEDTVADRDAWSYIQLADEVRRASADPRPDLHDLFRRMVFNAAVSNLDDHPRNHAMIGKDFTWRLSPVFDLQPSPVVSQDRRDLAMQCGSYGRFANRLNLLSQAGRFLLNEQQATQQLDAITRTVQSSWYTTLRAAGVSDTDCQAIEPAFLYEGFFREA